ncbi:TSUP family transporter [Clostridium ihumii]|uniref:TSUP family transporter n=1 Tax=Clostridium ihumii TaxID=1470356 RepID=UPI00058FDF05|nr:TSUP family transporter [Clostridium ihumii]
MLFKLSFLAIAGFFAAFIDAIAGGGGLISMPAYLMAGIPPHLSLGTNKFSASMGSLTSSYNFCKSGLVNFKLIKILAPFTFIGAILGVKTVLLLDESFLNVFVLFLILAIGIYTIFSKNIGAEDNFTGFNKKNLTLGIIFAFSLGFYDGFFGPGTGSFLVFGLIKIYKFDFLHSTANTKCLNFISNITALLTFALNNSINYKIGFIVAIFMVLGAKFGTKIAINKGSKLIKPIFITMSLAVALKMLINLI